MQSFALWRPTRYKEIITDTDAVRAIAKVAGVRRVVLTRCGVTSPEGKKRLIEAVDEVFPGEVLYRDELTTIDLLS